MLNRSLALCGAFFITEDSMKVLGQKEYLNVGTIVNTQGLKGEVRVMAVTDFANERFAKGSELLLFMKGQKEPITLTVESYRRHKNFHILKFEGLDSINDVEKYREGQLKVDREDLVDLEEDEFYYFQIIGCTVEDQTRGTLGKVTEILTPGANDVWVVESTQYGEVLIPYIDSVVLSVDVAHKQIEVDLPEGLID